MRVSSILSFILFACLLSVNTLDAQIVLKSWPPIRSEIFKQLNNGGDSAMTLANHYINEAKLNKDTLALQDGYLIRGDLYSTYLKSDSGLADILRAEELIDMANDVQMVKLNLTKAWYYDALNSISEAANYYNAVYIKSRVIGDKNLMSSAAMSLGGLLVQMGKPGYAFDYLQDGLEIRLQSSKTRKDSVRIHTAYSNLGYAYYYQKKYKEGFKNYMLAAKYVEGNSRARYFRAMLGAAECATNLGDYDEALGIFSAMGEYADVLDVPRNFITYKLDYSHLLREINKPEKALEELNDVNALIVKEGLTGINKTHLLGHLHKTYTQLNRDGDAYATLKILNSLQDSLHKEEIDKQFQRGFAMFDIAKKRKELDDLEKELKENKKSLDQGKVLMRLGLSLLTIITLIGMYFYLKKKEKEKYLAVLQDKVDVATKDLSEVNIELQKSNILLEDKNQEKTILLREIHHRVKNNMQMIVSIIRIERKLDETIDPEDLLDKLEQRIRSISEIHEKLYKPSGTNYKSINAKEFFDDVAYQIFRVFSPQLQGVFKLNVDVQSFSLPFDKVIQLGIVLNELFANTFKYGFKGMKEGEVSISLSQSGENEGLFIYKDTGCGFPESSLIKNDDEVGFGKQIVDLLISQLSGETKRYNDGGAVVQINFVIED
jgi:two-component sensor histidine kinase